MMFVYLFRRIKTVITSVGKCWFFAMGFRMKVTGKLATNIEAPILVAAPHSTFFDAAIGFVASLPSAVSASHNKTIPIIGSTLSKHMFRPCISGWLRSC